MLGHILHNFLDSDVDCVFNYPFVNISDNALDHSELLKELAAGFEDLLREDVLLPIDPEIRETFLRRVEDLGQIAKTAFFVKDFVGFGELLAVGSMGTASFENFAETFDLI